jgi:aspartate racemase
VRADAGPHRKTVGIIGGMGPAATAEFFRRLVAATHADADQDHLHVLIDSDPAIPDRTVALVHGGPSPLAHLTTVARRLEAMGADLLVIPL